MSDQKVLTPETVRQLRDAGPKDLVWLLCDSHELLRHERDEALRGSLKGTAAAHLGRRNVELHAINAQVVRRAERAESREVPLREAAQMLVAWDERWPDTRLHAASLFGLCHKELDACVDALRAALAISTEEEE